MAALPSRTALFACLLVVVALSCVSSVPPSAPGQGDSGPGLIAYARGGKEIHVIKPDGTGDRLLWSSAQATPDLGVNGLAWRPDGRELAFTSGHDAAYSLYDSD